MMEESAGLRPPPSPRSLPAAPHCISTQLESTVCFESKIKVGSLHLRRSLALSVTGTLVPPVLGPSIHISSWPVWAGGAVRASKQAGLLGSRSRGEALGDCPYPKTEDSKVAVGQAPRHSQERTKPRVQCPSGPLTTEVCFTQWAGSSGLSFFSLGFYLPTKAWGTGLCWARAPNPKRQAPLVGLDLLASAPKACPGCPER